MKLFVLLFKIEFIEKLMVNLQSQGNKFSNFDTYIFCHKLTTNNLQKSWRLKQKRTYKSSGKNILFNCKKRPCENSPFRPVSIGILTTAVNHSTISDPNQPLPSYRNIHTLYPHSFGVKFTLNRLRTLPFNVAFFSKNISHNIFYFSNGNTL